VSFGTKDQPVIFSNLLLTWPPECPLSGVEQAFSRKKYITKAPADLTKGPLDMFSWLFSYFVNRY
jgi:hypothetical protein